jgi:hypothetical protein
MVTGLLTPGQLHMRHMKTLKLRLLHLFTTVVKAPASLDPLSAGFFKHILSSKALALLRHKGGYSFML